MAFTHTHNQWKAREAIVKEKEKMDQETILKKKLGLNFSLVAHKCEDPSGLFT